MKCNVDRSKRASGTSLININDDATLSDLSVRLIDSKGKEMSSRCNSFAHCRRSSIARRVRAAKLDGKKTAGKQEKLLPAVRITQSHTHGAACWLFRGVEPRSGESRAFALLG
jgi:hypothetical protein